ncbi:MAG: winged helix-turn-helix transcriptional regulator [Actinobacteria bacterium]|nr:winged helix-turn-helix transcriptional regulator [Actinomycetota bacterium]MCB9413346.1 winged helix-turn-helix transcriptional regulator [Actinomycetota bacterium]
MNQLLPEALDRDLRAAFGIGLGEYEILVHLSESGEGRVRMADLAHATLASRSKLTHQVSRMERAGWVTRERCAEDARGQWALLTDAGWDLIRAAAPVHVTSVRRRLVDLLGPTDFAELGRLAEKVAGPLRDLPSISPPIGTD